MGHTPIDVDLKSLDVLKVKGGPLDREKIDLEKGLYEIKVHLSRRKRSEAENIALSRFPQLV